MIGVALADGDLKLVAPNVERDALLGVGWVNGEVGHETMRLMGNNPKSITDTTLKQQQKLIQSFIDDQHAIYWMLELNQRVVGAIWIQLNDEEYLPGPSVSIMIGDVIARGHGIGKRAMILVLGWARLHVTNLKQPLRVRALADNAASNALIKSFSALLDGKQYTDSDGLVWQNYQLKG
ncbi:GNAT family N-acetyltransferase [Candidatus Saccharibacteria bacterium]|nr:GNAT family N-acetyltransferase [Candidatus Saccharibacteria bacterium]